MIKTILGDQFTPTGTEVSVCNGRYLLQKRIGHGSFGEIFWGYDTQKKIAVAVKMEKKAPHHQLQHELHVYEALKVYLPSFNGEEKRFSPTSNKESSAAPCRSSSLDSLLSTSFPTSNPLSSAAEQVGSGRIPIVPGFPRVHQFATEKECSFLVLDLCGPNLEDLFNYCNRHFSLKTIIMLADQMLCRIEYLHSRGYVHSDLKPENFVLGRGPFGHIVYLVDFGLSKSYIDKRTKSHVLFAKKKPLIGTARYCSCNTHRGFQQSRRDDLESIGFLLIYFNSGKLPWQGLKGENIKEKTIAIGNMKMSTTLESLCNGLPAAFLTYMDYCRKLEFSTDPDYRYLRQLFSDAWLESYSPSHRTSGATLQTTVMPSPSPGLLPLAPGTPLSFFREGSPTTKKQTEGVERTRSSSNNVGAGFYPSRGTLFLDNRSKASFILGSKDVPNDLSYQYDLQHVNSSCRVQDGNAAASTTSHNSAAICSSPSTAVYCPHGPSSMYDWRFDWFMKRISEVQQHKALRRAAQ